MLPKKLKNKISADSSVAYTMLTKLFQGAGSMVILFMVTRYLAINEQGYYYTFTGILAIQVFFELGITSIVTQYVAYEFAHLSWSDRVTVAGDEVHRSRLTSILHMSVKWMGWLALFMFIAIFCVGYLFFFKTSDLTTSWRLPWLLLSFAGSVLLLLNLFFAVLEGLGKVKEVARLRFVQQAVYSFSIIILLFSGQKLLSAGAAILVSLMAAAFLMFYSGNFLILQRIWRTEAKWKINYRKEVLPFQYRMALGNISGYFIYQLITPVLFALQGPVIAGQMGATQAVLNGIQAISLSFMGTKVALFAKLAALREYVELNRLFGENLAKTVRVFLLGLIVFIPGVYLLKEFHPSLGARFLGLTPIFFFSLTQLASVIGNCQAYYLRSFKMEPFFIVSIVIGVVSGLTSIVFATYFSIEVFSAGYFVVNGVAGFAWGYWIFIGKKKEWAN